MARRFWTEEENSILRERYSSEGITISLQETLNRGRISIRHQAGRLGLISDSRWNADDDAILRRCYHELTAIEILPLLTTRRTCTAIQLRAQRLKLGEQCRWSKEEDAVLLEYYANGRWDKILPLIPNRTKQAIKIHARYIGLVMDRLAVRRMRYEQHERVGHHRCQSYGRILGSVILQCKRAALERDIDCPLLDGSDDSMQYLDSIASNVCSLTGLTLIYATKARDRTTTASLDRIDSTKGYIKGNVQWIHKTINLMKLDMAETDFIAFCTAVGRHRGGLK